MPLQTDYRPQTWGAVVGNKEATESLKALLARPDRNHCFLLTGDSGCGKTTLAYLIGKELKVFNYKSANNPNFRELNASDFRGIDTVRAIRQECSTMPLGDANRVFFLDECHALTPQAQEAFLAILEKANSSPNYFIFATTNPEALKITFKRRCTHYHLEAVKEKDLKSLLNSLATKEEIKLEPSIVEAIIDRANGSCGIAVNLLDQVLYCNEEEALSILRKNNGLEAQAIDLCRGLAKKESWSAISKILVELKDEDPEAIRRAVLGYASSWLLKKDSSRAYIILDAFIEPFYNSGFPGVVHACYMVLNG